MTTRTKKIIIFSAIGLILAVGVLLLTSKRIYSETRQFPIMSTIAVVTLHSESPELTSKAIDVVHDAMLEVETACNIFKPESELSKLNASAFKEPFKCSDFLWEILSEARRFHKISNGAFDVTVKPLMKVWGFHRKRGTLPSQQEMDEALKCVGLDKVEFNDDQKTVRFKVDGMGIDLGGIAKGWAVDKAAKRVLDMKVNSGMINLGGNMRCLPVMPPLPGGRGYYIIGIRNPFNAESYTATAKVINACTATSGDYERYVEIGGKHYTHIMDPRTGRPVENMLSASIITPLGVESDALSTSIFINGYEFAKDICRRIPGTSVLIIRRNPSDLSDIIMERAGDAWLESEIPVEPSGDNVSASKL